VTGERLLIIWTLTAVLLFLSGFDPLWAFGPHGDGAIGGAMDRAQPPRGFPVYQNYETPFSYPSMTRRDLDSLLRDGEVIEVEGSSRMAGFFIPIGLITGLGPTSGLSVDLYDRSIRAALDDATARYGVRHFYDIRIDLHIFSILGIYNTATTIVHAKAIREGTPPRSEDTSP
jgi:hypothetical protein